MTVGRICVREVDLAEPDETAMVAGQRMGARNVGTLLVIDDARRPVGILTDRDLALRVVGAGLEPREVIVAEVMTRNVRTIRDSTPIETALAEMRRLGLRRLAVVDGHEGLVGVLSVDDVLALLAEEFGSLGRILQASSPTASATV